MKWLHKYQIPNCDLKKRFIPWDNYISWLRIEYRTRITTLQESYLNTISTSASTPCDDENQV